jgi:hypothetical protein
MGMRKWHESGAAVCNRLTPNGLKCGKPVTNRRSGFRAQVTAEDMANAALFFVLRQTPTPGAFIPVDGGLPDATAR